MEEIYGCHLPMHDKLRSEYRKIVNSATYSEENQDGSITLYVNNYDEETQLNKKVYEWWSNVLSWSSGND